MLQTMLIPVVLVFIFYRRISGLVSSMLVVALLLFVNGLILYIPQFLPGSNRDSRTLSRLDGFSMGLSGTLSVIPGFSGVGAAVSVGSPFSSKLYAIWQDRKLLESDGDI